MTDFWETSFKDKQEMWGWEPASSVGRTLELFLKHNIKNILIPGFGYGRNAKFFIEKGLNVTGIEISETAIALAKKHFDEGMAAAFSTYSKVGVWFSTESFVVNRKLVYPIESCGKSPDVMVAANPYLYSKKTNVNKKE